MQLLHELAKTYFQLLRKEDPVLILFVCLFVSIRSLDPSSVLKLPEKCHNMGSHVFPQLLK